MTSQHKAPAAWAVVIAWIAFCIASLRTGWLHVFFFDTDTAHVQGIDFFPVPRALLNLIHGRSQFDTFHSNFGPYATWYLYHPILALFYGPLVAAFSPWHAYAVSTAISLAALALTTYLLARLTQNPMHRALIALLIMGSFPGIIMLYSGNIQPLIVLSLTLILVAFDKIAQKGISPRAERLLLAGLVLSLFSKPFVIAMFPLLLLLRETRRTALRALAIYLPVSALCLVIPGVNPVALTWADRWQLLTHLDTVKRTMNIYTNRMDVTPPMQDNSIHWLSMLGLSDFRLQHIDVMSLSSLLDGLFHTHTPPALYRVPIILALEISILVALVRDRTQRLTAASNALMAISLLLFLSYGLVWEYHYAAVMPLLALCILKSRRTLLDRAMLACGALVWLPSIYVFVRNQPLQPSMITALRFERVIPVAILFILLLVRATTEALQSPTGVRFLSPRDSAMPT